MKIRLVSVFLAASALILSIVLRELLYSEVEAQHSLRLQLPFEGTYRINSYVDHETPYRRNSTLDTIVMFNGQEYNNCPGGSDQWTTQGPYCYDGHEGIDWPMNENTPILAAASGEVIEAGVIPGFGALGNAVVIDHSNGYETWYAHLLTPTVDIGDEVSAGQQIALSGNTGNSTGPHLHFHVTHNQDITDPFGWHDSASDPLIDYSGEAAVCLWANTWCNETLVEDGDNSNDGPAKFYQYGDGWRWAAVGNSWTMKYVPNGDDPATYAYWIPFLDHPGAYEVFAFIPGEIDNRTTVAYTVHDRHTSYARSVNQAAYSNEWVSLGTYEPEFDNYPDRVISRS